MERQSITFLKYISIIQRNTGRYFDLSLEADQIGSGQQFFLLRIAENEGITMSVSYTHLTLPTTPYV